MKEATRRLFAAALAASLARPALAAAPLAADAAVSTATAKPEPFAYSLGYQKAATPQGRASVGARGGLAEGKPLEMSFWGGAGAVVGSVAGPFGALVGAAAGVAAGLLISVFVVPRNGPGQDEKKRAR